MDKQGPKEGRAQHGGQPARRQSRKEREAWKEGPLSSMMKSEEGRRNGQHHCGQAQPEDLMKWRARSKSSSRGLERRREEQDHD